ncbi:hypothetical protein WICPIJ_007145 [Wickerhamomyces pijperi]|uniref:Uncharacterized protein n=1 Tax=Wickerhamomyces pijperi TaxID=599730 RepID=A0A9P8Q0G1_WICPI|nr:hypothetical protein WICPIJ_007145 [Wickerhamomyces pijperi]
MSQARLQLPDFAANLEVAQKRNVEHEVEHVAVFEWWKLINKESLSVYFDRGLKLILFVVATSCKTLRSGDWFTRRRFCGTMRKKSFPKLQDEIRRATCENRRIASYNYLYRASQSSNKSYKVS